MNTPLLHRDLLVKKSPIHGYGVFANQDIKAGEIIEECYTLPVKTQVEKNVLLDYLFYVKGREYCALLLGNGSLYNHSSQPNARYEFIEDRKVMVFSSLRDIKKGEEIFASYGPNWFSSREILPKEPTLKAKLKQLLPKVLIFVRAAIVLGICLGIAVLSNH